MKVEALCMIKYNTNVSELIKFAIEILFSYLKILVQTNLP